MNVGIGFIDAQQRNVVFRQNLIQDELKGARTLERNDYIDACIHNMLGLAEDTIVSRT